MSISRCAYTGTQKRKHPSAIGCTSPILRLKSIIFDNGANQRLSSGKLAVALERIIDFRETVTYKGKYHNRDHFEDVRRRFIEDLHDYAENNPGVLTGDDYLYAEIFAQAHDLIHHGYSAENQFTLNVETIAKYYGFDETKASVLQTILAAVNFGIDEDNMINLEAHLAAGMKESDFIPRPKVANFTDVIDYSEEELSQIVVDSIMFTAGCSLDERMVISGMIQATEFKRSMAAGGQLPFKAPRTQREFNAKLADMGNIREPFNKWLSNAVRVNTEAPWFKGETVMDFINEELFFIENYLKPLINPDNLPVITNGNGRGSTRCFGININNANIHAR